MQAQDRAYRIGQRKDVEVYRFIASNTIEEKVYQRQLYKHGQEGLALHQRDEARYFDGVMDDRSQQGELFGIKNLLAFDRSGAGSLRRSGTADIVKDGRKGRDDARLFSVERVGDSNAKRTEVDVAEDDDEENEQEDGKVFDDDSGVRWLVDSLTGRPSKSEANGPGSGGRKRARSEDAGSSSAADRTADDSNEALGLLRQTGAVHIHKASDVVGGDSIRGLVARASEIESAAAAAEGARRQTPAKRLRWLR